MEEILSSIKRIIAEDSDALVTGISEDADSVASRRDSDRMTHRKAVVASMADSAEDSSSYVDEVLELTDEMPNVGKTAAAQPAAQPATPAMPEPDTKKPRAVAPKTKPATESQETKANSKSDDTAANMIVSVESEIAARSSLAALSSMIVKPEDGDGNTLEGMVREMLRPMLKEWLDANLPTLVEGMVAKEIARITGRSL